MECIRERERKGNETLLSAVNSVRREEVDSVG